MSKGSATALILIALALAGIAVTGYVAITGANVVGDMLGAPVETPAAQTGPTVGLISPTTATIDTSTKFSVKTSTDAVSCDFYWNGFIIDSMNKSQIQQLTSRNWEISFKPTGDGNVYADCNNSRGVRTQGQFSSIVVTGIPPGPGPGPIFYTLTVNKVGTGSGHITFDPPGVASLYFPATYDYASGTAVTITAYPDDGSTFSGWSGNCTGMGNCVLTINSAKTVAVNFTDTQSPQIGVSVSPELPLTGETVTITAETSDNIAIGHGNIYLDDVNVLTSGEFNTPTATFSFPTSALLAGQHNFSADVDDMAGNRSRTAVKNFTVLGRGVKGIGEHCISVAECKAGLTCSSGVCADIEKPTFESVVLSPETIYEGEPVVITAAVNDTYALKTIDFYIDNKLVWDTCSRAQHKTPPEPNIFNKTTGTCTNTMEYENESPVNLGVGSHNYRIVVSDMQPNYAFSPGPTGSEVKPFTVSPPPQVLLTVEPATQKGEAGDTLYYNLELTNKRGIERTFGLEINLLSWRTGWSILPNATQQTIANDDTYSATIAVKSKYPEYANNYTLRAYAFDALDSTYNSTAKFNYTVGLCGRVAPDLSSSKTSKFKGPPGAKANFTITVTNKDTCTGYFNYSVGCPDDWDCELSKKSSTLDVGEDAKVLLEIESADDAEPDAYILEFAAVNMKKTSAVGLKNITFTVANCTDFDKDGYYKDCDPEDCDDTDPNINPDADENCYDQIDNNCNGKIDAASEGCTGSGYNPANASRDNAPQYDTATPDCGNNVVETGEDCDGTTDSQCPGLCTFDCTCPFIVEDGVCESDLGESSAVSTDCQKKLSGTGLAMIAVGILGALAASTFYFWRRKGKFGGLAVAHGVETATPGVDLDTAVNSMLSEGYNPEEIHGNLEAGGWSHNKIDAAMESAQTDQEALGELAKQQGVAAPTEKAKASRYVKKCLEQGYDPTQIRTALMSSGWPADAVDGVISKQTAKHLQAHAEKAGVTEPSSAHKEDLADYVKKELSEGHTKQSIKKVLKDTGWPSSDVNKAFKE